MLTNADSNCRIVDGREAKGMIVRFKIGKDRKVYTIRANNSLEAAKVLKKNFKGKEIKIIGTADEADGKGKGNL